MPVLFLDRLPLPNLKIYTALSVLLLSSSVYYAVQVTSQPGFKRNVTDKVQTNSVVVDAVGSSSSSSVDDGGTVSLNRDNDDESSDVIISNDNDVDNDDDDDNNGTVSFTNVVYYMVEEPLCIWTLINMAYCCLILIGKVIQKIVFGELRVSEQQHVKDKFWNFVFYKFIFIFGVMNVQFMDEVVLWCSWFSVLGFLHLLAQLCKDRFEYLSFSPTMPKWTHVRLLSLLIGILVTSSVLLVICVLVGLHAGINTFAFMGAECVLLNVCTLFVIVRYALHLWDMNHDGVWENRGTYVYYTELVFELLAFFIDLLHHIHMLLWSNIFLSMASLVICMQIRYLFYEIQRRFKKHKNYLRVVRHMEQNYPMGTTDELAANSDDCAICWDKMESARKLPCGHLFHNSCLQSWLEQDTSCPTCRTSLAGPTENNSDPLRNRNTERGNPIPNRLAGNPIGATAHPNRTTTNHFFHFDGSRYVSWFPSFSVEVTHTQLLHRQAHMQTSQLDSMVWQVQQLFPQMPLNAIREDLRTTRSVDATVDNILEERLVAPPFQMQQGAARMGSNIEPTTSLQDSSLPSQSTSDTSSDFNESRNNSPITDEDLDLLDESQFQQAAMDLESSEPRHVNVGGRFSKSPQEREKMLAGRKDDLLKQAKKRYVLKKYGDGGRQEETGDAENRRYLAYEAARRRLKRNDDET